MQTVLDRVEPQAMPEAARAAWQQLHALTGDASFVEVFASAPKLLQFVMEHFYSDIFFAGELELRYKQLARLRLSTQHGCLTCNKQNVPGSLEAGVSQEQVDQLHDYENGPFSEAEKAVLRFTDLMLLSNQQNTLPDSLAAELKRHFSAAQICELGVVTAVISGMAKLSFVMDLVEREDYCTFS